MGKLSNISEEVHAMFKEKKSMSGAKDRESTGAEGSMWCQQRGHRQPPRDGEIRARTGGEWESCP